MRKLLFWLTSHLPCRIIAEEGSVYLERYYLFTLLGWRFYLHRFVGSDPDRGLLAPAEFVPLAESTDLVDALEAEAIHTIREVAAETVPAAVIIIGKARPYSAAASSTASPTT